MRLVTTRGQHHTGKASRLAKPPQGGVTLIELLVALAVLVITITWAVPSFQQFSARNEVAAEVLRIKTALSIARNTAIARRTKITVCSSTGPLYETCDFDDWSHDWVIVEGKVTGGRLTGHTILRQLKSMDGVTASFSRNDRPVQYGELGRTTGYNGTFSLCGHGDAGAQVVVSNFGRVRVETTQPSCPDT
ncbi:GspH/FimT family pseudopilin [Halomonas cerina]|uniref:Type II secretion system protein H n=1 Tax=Halomonas cerina TaxID=447424 RepID=A0A839VGZ4_9GAMM|nr:GspH/FimT family pseudopilin [Halomonas cerina]MBB3191666.1 type IV fimbrial biogenesis protein FimT [Halomonas cerina]